MFTLYHAPHSRSSRILMLMEELGVDCDTRIVNIRRLFSGTGAPDPANPHPEGKVPLLVHDGQQIWESAAIFLYLTDMYPESGMGIPLSNPKRGRFLAWLFYYAGVIEPLMVTRAAGLRHDYLTISYRGMKELTDRLSTALAVGPWLMGKEYTSVDLLLSSPFLWFPDTTPDDPIVKDWVNRCGERPSYLRIHQQDADLLGEQDETF